jgi:two-component system response regulator VanR
MCANMDIQILLVEDDSQINSTIAKFLKNAGYSVDSCLDGDEALAQFYEKKYHLAILDIMLPGINGQELLREIRKISDVPALMITALEDDDSQLAAFSNEADDYVTKPFSMQILLKRVEALLRRSGALKKEIQVGKLTLYPESYKALYDGADTAVTPREFEMLMLLCQNKGKIIPHETLIARIWGYDFEGNERIIHAHMRNLRSKIPASIIATVKGVGYRLEENICEK